MKDSNPISSCSPRIRFIENKHKPNTTTDQNTKPKAYTLKEEQESSDKKLVSKCKKDANEKFSSRFKRLPKTSDINIRSTSNSRANDIRSNTKSKRISNVLSIGTESSHLANKIPLKQVLISHMFILYILCSSNIFIFYESHITLIPSSSYVIYFSIVYFRKIIKIHILL